VAAIPERIQEGIACQFCFADAALVIDGILKGFDSIAVGERLGATPTENEW